MVFLQILGVILLVLILVGLVYGLTLYKKRKGLKLLESEFSTVHSFLPAIQLVLEPSGQESWLFKERLVQDQTTLKKMGFEEKGSYVFSKNLIDSKVSLMQLKNSILVVITETTPTGTIGNTLESKATYTAEVIALLDNNGSVCITNSLSFALLPRPREHPFLLIGTENIIELVKAVKSAIPSGRKVRAIKKAKHVFIQYYQQMAEWVWQEEQLRSEKMKGVFVSLNIQFSENLIQELITYSSIQISDLFSDKLLSAVSANPKISQEQWENIRDKLVIVHEKMDTHSICKSLYTLVGDNLEEHEELIENLSLEGCVADDPIQTFKKYFNLMSLETSTKRIASVRTPIVGEVYLPR